MSNEAVKTHQQTYHEVFCGGESRHAGRHFSEIGGVVTDTKTQQSSSSELFILSKIEAIEFQSFW